jgi:hypothetical protein
LAKDLHNNLSIIKDKEKQIKEIYNFLYKSYILGTGFTKYKDYKRIVPIKKL